MIDIFEKYPELKERIELLCQSRRNDILTDMLHNEAEYKKLSCRRADTSMTLKNALVSLSLDNLLEEYSDAVYAQETYELDAIYKQAAIDIILTIHEMGILS